MSQRGIRVEVAEYLEFFLPSIYENQSNKIFLSTKTAKTESKRIRKFAEFLEKHAGVELVMDQEGLSLITAYRK